MNWGEGVLSGNGLLGLTWLIQWLRRRSSSPTKEAAITAQGAKVSDSPVASGSGINQTVSTVHHHYYAQPGRPALGPTAATDAPVAVPAPEQHAAPSLIELGSPERHSQIIATASRVIRVNQTGRTEWSDRGPYFHQDAMVIEFTNEAGTGFRNSQHVVRASLVYSDAGREVLRITGGWVNQETDLAEFRVEQSQKLIVGVLLGEQLFAVEQNRRAVSAGSETCEMTNQPLRGFQHGTVRVRLTDIHSQVLLYEGRFDITIRPLQIAPHLQIE